MQNSQLVSQLWYHKKHLLRMLKQVNTKTWLIRTCMKCWSDLKTPLTRPYTYEQ